MKRIDIDDDIYTYIAANTEHIGESASQILRRLLNLNIDSVPVDAPAQMPAVSDTVAKAAPSKPQGSAQKVVFDVLTPADLAGEKSVVGRFLHILSMLYRCHSDTFDAVLDIKGRDRVYFATTEEALVQAGNSTNPKQIPQSPYWVITNNNTTKKKSMLTQAAHALGYNQQDVERIRDFL
ncbi:MAG: replication initiation negative regulator SeqA [Firmicutes bacterium]|nr:replication initiation negative regulator SeqA [Bacillota bacterium]